MAGTDRHVVGARTVWPSGPHDEVPARRATGRFSRFLTMGVVGDPLVRRSGKGVRSGPMGDPSDPVPLTNKSLVKAVRLLRVLGRHGGGGSATT